MKTIALFGGSFDPPHIAHITIVEKLLDLNYIDKVVVMPTYLNPFKSRSYACAELRIKWLKDIFHNYNNVEVSSYEVDLNKKVSSIETVKYLLKQYTKIYLVIGADNLKNLHKWDRYHELKNLVEFIVATRDKIDINSNYQQIKIDMDISSTQLREKIDTKEFLPTDSVEINKFYKEIQMKERLERITKVLDDNKAENIELFDLRDKNYFVDYAIIASSLGTKHTMALLNYLKTDLKPAEVFNNVDESGDWIVVDLGDILIHIMTPEYRAKYDLEKFLSELSNGKDGDSL